MRKKLKCFLCYLLTLLSVILPVSASGGDDLFDASVSVGTAAVSSEPPGVSAQSAVLTDGTGKVLYSHLGDKRLPMASTTKIMTALAALKLTDDPDKTVKIPKEAIGVEGSSVYLYQDEELTVRELLYAMLMESANDAAAAIAILTAGSIAAFADEMNRIAGELGLQNTHFMNPHGLDDDAHYTTAEDLAALTAAALDNPDFREIVSTYKKEIPLRGGEGVRLLVNHNRLLKSYTGCIGVKTGYTRHSGRCLVTAAERNGCRLICVTLNAPDDWNDHRALLDWGFSRYECVTLSLAGEQYAVVPVVGAETENRDGIATVAVKNTEPLQKTLLRDGQNIRKVVELPHFLYAPVTTGDPVGYARYYNGDELIGVLPLYACEDVPLYVKPTLIRRILAFLGFGNRKKSES